MTRRALVLVLDSVGCGAAPDADAYGDAGADTLGHVLAATGIALPTLFSLGLDRALGRPGAAPPRAAHGRMRPRAAGKDSTTGHWEIAGAVLDEPFATFDRFPDALVAAIEAECGTRFLGNIAASGTAIIEELGPEHLRTGRPILYTSADSVLQIAAHEAILPLARLHAMCEAARRHADAWRIGRVIARPFEGGPGAFRRTAGRHDFSMRPPPTVLDALSAASLPVIGIGKTGDLFAGQGLSASHPTASNAEGMARTAALWPDVRSGLLFTNLVDFDTLFGHRRDAAGYAAALAAFDAWLATFLPSVGDDDLLILTADHGNDPTFRGTDHTREEVPLLVRHRGRADPLGTRDGFADVGATLAGHFGVPSPAGRSFLMPA
jgi:phosphopentomutase